MIVYNITLHADHSIHDAWLQWHKEEHIPEVMATKQFTEYRLFHLLEQDETEGITYVTQYFASSADHLKKYVEEFSPSFRKKINDKWGNHLVIFRTVMEVMH
ncbi:MAG: DUF4286 family protein [Bacteroidota bacterium]